MKTLYKQSNSSLSFSYITNFFQYRHYINRQNSHYITYCRLIDIQTRQLQQGLKLVSEPGDHVLSVSLRVEGVRSFEIRAQLHTDNDPKSTVVCIGLVGLTLRNVSSMTLDGLTFYSCGNGAGGYGPVPDHLTAYGMLIILGKDIMIFNCSFEDSATALGVFYSNLHMHGNSFTNFCNGHSCSYESWSENRIFRKYQKWVCDSK